jgi:hypothetical protein
MEEGGKDKDMLVDEDLEVYKARYMAVLGDYAKQEKKGKSLALEQLLTELTSEYAPSKCEAMHTMLTRDFEFDQVKEAINRKWITTPLQAWWSKEEDKQVAWLKQGTSPPRDAGGHRPPPKKVATDKKKEKKGSKKAPSPSGDTDGEEDSDDDERVDTLPPRLGGSTRMPNMVIFGKMLPSHDGQAPDKKKFLEWIERTLLIKTIATSEAGRESWMQAVGEVMMHPLACENSIDYQLCNREYVIKAIEAKVEEDKQKMLPRSSEGSAKRSRKSADESDSDQEEQKALSDNAKLRREMALQRVEWVGAKNAPRFNETMHTVLFVTTAAGNERARNMLIEHGSATEFECLYEKFAEAGPNKTPKYITEMQKVVTEGQFLIKSHLNIVRKWMAIAVAIAVVHVKIRDAPEHKKAELVRNQKADREFVETQVLNKDDGGIQHGWGTMVGAHTKAMKTATFTEGSPTKPVKPVKDQPSPVKGPAIVCTVCKKPGHKAYDCRLRHVNSFKKGGR